MTTDAPETGLVIRYEGPGVGTELWGGTQANFQVFQPGAHAKEFAVLLQDAAAAQLASAAEAEDTPEFRERAARVVGALWLTRMIGAGRHVDPVAVLSRAAIDQAAGFLDEARAALASSEA